MITECTGFHEPEQWKVLTARLRAALPPPPAPSAAGQPPVPQPAASSAPSMSTTPADSEHLAAIEAYIAASGGPVKKTSCGAVTVPADVPSVQTLQDAATGLHRALVQAREDVRCVTGVDAARMAAYQAEHLGRSPFEWHRPLLDMWLAYVQSLAARLPAGASGVGMAAAAAAQSEVVLFDSAASDSMKSHQSSADGPLRPAQAHRTQVANGSVMSVNEKFDAAIFVRCSDDGQLIKVVEGYDHNPGLRSSARSLTIMSTYGVLKQGGEARLREGGSYVRFMATDPSCPDLPPFLLPQRS